MIKRTLSQAATAALARAMKRFRPVPAKTGHRRSRGLFLALLLLAAALPASAQSLERVRDRGRLVIGTDATYQPFEFMEHGELRGFDVELGNEIGRELGVPVEWVVMEWAGIFPGLETGKFDLVMSGVTITEERKKGLGFSRPYFLSGQTVVRRRGDTRIRGSRDLRDKVVAVQQETTGQTAAERLGLPKERIHRFDTLPDALTDVVNRKSDAAIGDLPALKEFTRKGFAELELVGGVFVEENLGVVARKRETDLIAAVNRALGRIMVDGRYARIYEQWIGEPLTTAALAGLDRVKDQGTPVRESSGAGAASAAATREEPQAGSAFSIRFDLLGQVLPLLLQGARLTVLLTLAALAIGIPGGLLIALARLSTFQPLRLAATTYVEAVRGTPLLMQIYVIYFVLPAVGISLPALVAGIAALSLNAAAYISEIFRAGIESIEAGQMEAARSLGMDYGGAMRWVILPQTIRRVLPPMTNEAVALLKDSSLVSVVALAELMRVGKELATTSGSPITIYLFVALIYLAMTLPLTHLVRRLERKWQPVSRPRLAAVPGKQQVA
jgi:His/Glu/Gln/Arg/opine family amino acid ABC transporter permease subunit